MPVTKSVQSAIQTNHTVVARGANGGGSDTGNNIRRFDSATTTGTYITYADSSVDGASFTINRDGLYAIEYTDGDNTSGHYHGVSLNASTTAQVTTLTAAEVLCMTQNSAADRVATTSATVYLDEDDVLRPHFNSATVDNVTDLAVLLRITWLGE